MKNLIPSKLFLFLLLFSFFNLFTSLSFSQSSQKVFNSEKYTEDSIQLISYWEKYWRFDNNNQHDSAIIICQNMIKLGKELMAVKYDSTLFEKYGKAYAGVGYNLMELGKYDEALDYSMQSYDTLKSRFGDSHIRITEVLVGISINYSRRGDYDHALEYIFKSLYVMNNCLPKDHHYFANNYGTLANIYKEKKDFPKAVEFANKSIIHSENSPRLPSRLLLLAEIYLSMGKIDLAKNAIDKSYFLNKKKIKNQKYTTLICFRYGQVYAANAEFELAELYFNRFLSRIGTHQNIYEDFPVAGDGYFEIAKILQEKHEYESAILYYLKAIDSWNSYYGEDHPKVIYTLQQIGKIHLKKGKPEKALAQYQLALNKTVPSFFSADYYINPKLIDLPSNLLVLETLFVKAKAFKDLFQQNDQLKDLEIALSTYELAFSLIDKMRANYFWENSKAELSESIVPQLEEAINTALTFYNRTSERQYLGQAYQFIAKSKSIILAESIKDLQARDFTGVPESSLEEERHLKEDVSFYEKLIYEEDLKEKQDSVKLFYWHNKLLEKKTSYKMFISKLEKEFPDYSRQKNIEDVVSVFSIQKAIDDETAVIEYFLGDTQLFIFGISKSEIIFKYLPFDTTLFDHVQQLKSLFYDFQTIQKGDEKFAFERFADHSHTLYKRLVESVLSQFEVKNIVFIPDGILSFIPFESLLTAYPEEEKIITLDYRNLSYLFLEYSIRLEYSSQLLFQNRQNKNTNHLYLGFAPKYRGDELYSAPSVDSAKMKKLYPIASRDGLKPLQFNQPEVSQIGELLNGNYYLAEEAVESLFKNNAPSYKILHLAMHSMTNDLEPRYSQLVFSDQSDTIDDGKLQAYELTNMQLNAELAVLSACNTGSGKLRKGEGVMSLSRAFKNAGCPNIVMSLWKANDASTKDIMVSFFEKLKAGKGKTDALRKAKLEFLSSCEQQFTHPYYWATFVLVGDNEPINFGRPWWVTILIGLGIFLTFLFAFKFLKTKFQTTLSY